MNELKMLNQEELAALLNVSREQVATLREVGVIRAIKTGKCYMFSQLKPTTQFKTQKWPLQQQ